MDALVRKKTYEILKELTSELIDKIKDTEPNDSDFSRGQRRGFIISILTIKKYANRLKETNGL